MAERASEAARDRTIQAAVLRRLLHGPPQGYGRNELSALLAGTDPPRGMAARIARALEVLSEVGLIDVVDGKYVATRAAIHYRELLTR